MDKPLVQINVKKWLGRISNASPHRVPPGGAVIQENLRCQIPGQLDVRPGTLAASPTVSGAYNCYTYPFPSTGDYLLVQVGATVNALQNLT